MGHLLMLLCGSTDYPPPCRGLEETPLFLCGLLKLLQSQTTATSTCASTVTVFLPWCTSSSLRTSSSCP